MGKLITVTGGSSGLGKAIHDDFMRLGAKVTSISRHTGYDVRNNRIPKEADILVCCAGVYGPIGPIEANSLDMWKDCIATNLIGVVNCCHAVIPYMKAKGHGKIIILSGGGAVKARPNFSAYATSKAAVVRFMECIAEELKPHGIDVNCLAPGALNTGIHQAVIEAGPERAGAEEYAKALGYMEKTGGLAEAVTLARWLASDLSNGITGRLVSVHHDYLALAKD